MFLKTGYRHVHDRMVIVSLVQYKVGIIGYQT